MSHRLRPGWTSDTCCSGKDHIVYDSIYTKGTEKQIYTQKVGQGLPGRGDKLSFWGGKNTLALAVSDGCILLRIWKDTELGAFSSTLWRVNHLNKIFRDKKASQSKSRAPFSDY